MNIRDANAEDIISFVRNHIEARHDRTTYTTIKNQCLQIYTEKSFQHHKSLIQKLLKDRVARKKGKVLLEPSKKQIRTGLMVVTAKDTETLWLRWICGSQSIYLDLQRNKLAYQNVLSDQLGIQAAQCFQLEHDEDEDEGKITDAKEKVSFKPGDLIFARRFMTRSYTGTRYVSGTIITKNENDTYHVRFHDQDAPEDLSIEPKHMRRNSSSQNETKETNNNLLTSTKSMSMIFFGSTIKNENQWCEIYGQHNINAGQRITNVISILYKDINQCNPMLPSVLGVMLNVLPEETVFVLLCRLIESSNKYLITSNTIQTSQSVVAILMTFVEKYGGKKLHDHLFMYLDMDILWDMFHLLLSNVLMHMYVNTRLMDVYLNEGKKVLYRFIVAIIIQNKTQLYNCTTQKEMTAVLLSTCGKNQTEGIHENKYIELSKKAFNLANLKRSTINKLTVQYNQTGYIWKESKLDNPNQQTTNATTLRAGSNVLTVVGECGLLGKNVLDLLNIQQFLPPTHQQYDLKLLFTTNEDGCRLDTLYTRSPSDQDRNVASVLIVRPANETCLIGVMLSCSWRPTGLSVDRRNPQCVLFRLNGKEDSMKWNINYKMKEHADVHGEEGPEGGVSNVDQRIVNTTSEFLQIGISNTINQSGLYLDNKLNVGYAGTCDIFSGGRAYRKEGEDEKFSVGVVELYGLGHYQ